MTAARIQDVRAGFEKVGRDYTTISGRVDQAVAKVSGYVTLEQFGGSAAAGFDNADALAAAVASGLPIDLLGKRYGVSSTAPLDQKTTSLFNGDILRTTDSSLMRWDAVGGFWRENDGRNWEAGISAWNSVRLAGAARGLTGWNRGVYAIGYGSLDKATGGSSIIAIGPNIISQAVSAPSFNIGIGDSALTHLGKSGTGADRNIGIGSLAGHFMDTGRCNTLVGRDAGHNVIAGQENVAIGYQALFAGWSPIGWSGGIEMMYGGMSAGSNTAVGTLAARWVVGADNTIVGARSAMYLKSGTQNVVMGFGAMNEADRERSWSDTVAAFDLSVSFTYVVSGGTVTVTLSSVPSVGIAVGDTIGAAWASGPLMTEHAKAVVTGVSGSTITFATPAGKANGGGTGTLALVVKTAAAAGVASQANVVLGASAARYRTRLVENIVIGTDAGRSQSASDRTAVWSNSVIIGTRAARDMTQMTGCTVVGHQAARFMIDGSTTGTVSGSSALGNDARVSGDNQVQLGGTGTTPYAYAALQVRSDERDKADIQPTALGLDFISRIQPVQYRWDMRDDYVSDIPEDERADWWSNPVKDGSKKRSRLHQGVIAQQVRAVCEEMGVDFSGLQDHAIAGGNDVLTVGYEHFVPVLIRAVQELAARVEQLEAQA